MPHLDLLMLPQSIRLVMPFRITIRFLPQGFPYDLAIIDFQCLMNENYQAYTIAWG